MDPHKLAVTLAIAAGWLSFNSLILTAYFLLSKQIVLEGSKWKTQGWLKLGQQEAPVSKRNVEVSSPTDASVLIDNVAMKANTSSALPEQEDSVEEVAPAAEENSVTHVLFVMFDQPDAALNKKLHMSLQGWEAHYDEALKMYIVPGVTPQNPLRVANAYPPGKMPPADSFQLTENLISGVSVILQKPKRRRGFDKVQLEKLVAFTQELAALGGSVLDSERQVATLKTFQAIRYK